MKLKTNLFERITQHYYEDGMDIHWWIDADEEEDFLSSWGEDNPDLKKTETREISGKEWNEFWIGGVYGDYEGKFVNEICPEENCGHLLVDPEMDLDSDEDEKPIEGARYCSNFDDECGYRSPEFIAANAANEAYWTEQGNRPPEKQIRLVDEDIFQFVERVGLSLDKADKFVILNDNYWTECTVCKETVPASDFYIGQETGFAVVHFKHDDCSNGGPSIGVTFSKKAKEKWCGILGK